MYCKSCGKTLNQGGLFCANCGAKVENENNIVGGNTLNQNIQNSTISNVNNLDNNINQNQRVFNQPFADNQASMGNVHQQAQYTQPQQPYKPERNKLIKILAIIGGIVVGFIILFIIIFSITSASSEKLVCKSNEGNITIMYNKNGITGYTASGMSYDLDAQQDYAKKIGMDAYITEFDNWFKSNTLGYCTIDGEKVSEEEIKDNDKNNNDNNNNETTTIVGDNKYGYITIPKNWAKFYDVDGNTSLQYSYANVYIVSLNYFEDSQYTAKEYASNYMYNKQNSSDVTGVTGATVQIGKNKEYTAYQVYMYYPSDGTYLVTYWFEAEDGKVHYIALEGPEELSGVSITDYLYIPESFSLNK